MFNQWEYPAVEVKDTAASVPNAVDVVKEKCWNQREALPGEPKCVICGRYGEYICDETDDDICSLECKQVLLHKTAHFPLPDEHPNVTRIPTTDECFYVKDTCEKSKLQRVNGNQAELLRKRLGICVKGDGVPEPIMSFHSCNLPAKLILNMEAAGYEMPTPVQMQAIPTVLCGKSLLVSADTGSGKTDSFLVPIVSMCSKFRFENLAIEKKPLAMVMTPTRELCVQVEERAKVLGKGLPFKTALVVGGDAMAGQLHRILQGIELIVGTPGRLIDLFIKHEIELDSVLVFVLDEVDCMLQRDFCSLVMQIFQALSQPQVLMYSATVSQAVEKMARSMKNDLSIISVGRTNKPCGAVRQLAIWVESKRKKQKLFEILMSKQHFKPPVLVFVGSRLGADLLSEAISLATGIKALSMHGEKPMKERREIMRSFLVGEAQVIVATGVLSRGVDLLIVRQVIVFDMPNSIKEYVHQAGRASRRGQEGEAIIFVNDENKNLFTELVDMLKSSGAAVPRQLVNSRYSTVGPGQRKRNLGC